MPARRPFVDRRVEDAVAARALAIDAAVRWELPAPVLVRTGMNAIFAAGDVMLRVGRPTVPAAASIELARRLAAHGVRVARPWHDTAIERGGLSVTCWERIEPSGAPIDWAEVGRMVAVVHALDESVIPMRYPLPEPTGFPWWDFSAMFATVGDAIDAPAAAGLRAAVERWPAWTSMRNAVVCHGDVHPGNVMMAADGAVLIDWDLLCRAPRGWDHGPLMTWSQRWGGEPGVYERFAEGYGVSLRGDPDAEAFAELRLVAATLMRIVAGATDDVARAEAERRLQYWRGDPGAPQWRAQ